MLLNRPNWPVHYKWIFFVALVTIGAFVWYGIESQGASAWPGGSSRAGFWFGVAGGVIILFECALWVRKRYFRVWRIGTAQTWLRAHIWLGLLCLPLLCLHAGPRLGGWLSTVLMVLLWIVVGSGILGVILQNVLPKRMLDEIPGETIYSQMDALSGQLVSAADRLVSATCGTQTHRAEVVTAPADTGPTIGTVRKVGQVQGFVPESRLPTTAVPDSEALAVFYGTLVKPYLHKGSAGSVALASTSQATVLFQDIRLRVPPAAHEAVDELEQFCEQRRQWELQARLHFWLHCWLWLHFPLSMALLVLMAVHVFVALKYW